MSLTSGRTFDVAPDGQRFLMINTPGRDTGDVSSMPSLVVVQHLDEELGRLAPVK